MRYPRFRPHSAARCARDAAVPLPMAVKLPPTRMAPSDCTAIAFTSASGAGAKLVSSVPSVLSRAMRLWVTRFTVAKPPPMRILPSASNAIAAAAAGISGWVPLSVSTDPSTFRRARRVRLKVPLLALMLVKVPLIQILPSGCTATAVTPPTGVTAEKVVSTVPSAFSRATYCRVTPLIVVKVPPMTILPSDCMAIAATLALRLKVCALPKVVSTAPAARPCACARPAASSDARIAIMTMAMRELASIPRRQDFFMGRSEAKTERV